jgi:BirA family biotin operon repressor/biotin-[acetyl-CoA-carboxylase] ligase
VQPSRFDAGRFADLAARRGLELGLPLEVLDRTTSTMDAAFGTARSGAPHGAVVVAEAQTAGRGQHGRAWASSTGRDLTFSLLLFPRLSPEAVPLVAVAAGLAVRETVAARVAEATTVKWPNDVLVEGRKIAGVLVERRPSGAAPAVVVGVGINVETRSFPPEVAGRATSLLLAGATERAREPLLADFLAAFAPRLAALERGAAAEVARELALHDALRDRALAVGAIRGHGAGIASTGELLVRTADGGTVVVSAGTVELVAEVGAP